MLLNKCIYYCLYCSLYYLCISCKIVAMLGPFAGTMLCYSEPRVHAALHPTLRLSLSIWKELYAHTTSDEQNAEHRSICKRPLPDNVDTTNPTARVVNITDKTSLRLIRRIERDFLKSPIKLWDKTSEGEHVGATSPSDEKTTSRAPTRSAGIFWFPGFTLSQPPIYTLVAQ